MSYDTSLVTRCRHCSNGKQHYDANYTYNVSGMFRLALYGSTESEKGWTSLDGMKVSDALPMLNKAYEHMSDPVNANTYRKMNPSNGWGDFEGATRYLKDLLDACREWPDAVIEVR